MFSPASVTRIGDYAFHRHRLRCLLRLLGAGVGGDPGLGHGDRRLFLNLVHVQVPYVGLLNLNTFEKKKVLLTVGACAVYMSACLARSKFSTTRTKFSTFS